MELREIIGANIRSRRTRRFWSQDHLARASGVNIRTVQRAEEGKGISMETILAIAGALDVPVGELQADASENAPGTVRSDELRATSKAPAGTVALVCGDVQGTTPLWERDPLMMRRAMVVHLAVVRRLIERHGGYEVRTEGDTFMSAFRSPVPAIEFCLAAQSELLDAEWPQELSRHPEAAEIHAPDGAVVFRGLRVRMAVHTGVVDTELDPVTGRTDYFGRVVNCAMRLVRATHGGQVLASREAWSLAEDQISAETEDLGEVRLQGLSSPVGLIQVHPPTKHRRRFPPLLCDGGNRTNLVPARTSLVGRGEEIERITGWLRADKRLVSLVGPGGAGKTRLGRAVGAALSSDFSGGVWLVELAAAKTPEAALEAIGEVLALDLKSAGTVDARIAVIGNALGARGPLVLILDNAEHLVPFLATTLGRWLEAVPAVRIVVTTQHQLTIAGEQLCPVSGLMADDARQLFIERARQVCPLLALGTNGEALVDEVAARLERLPLALELAAARMKVLGIAEISDRLAARFCLLHSSGGELVARHATLRATIEWSFSLLKPYEQAALVDLARLPGSFDVSTAEAILDLGAFADAPAKLDVVQSLLEKSLIWASDSRASADETRLRLYESVRAFALEQPTNVGSRLVAWALCRGEALNAQWKANPSATIAKRMLLDIENYGAAMESAVDDDPDAGLRLHDVILAACDHGGPGSVPNGFGVDIAVREQLWNSACRSPDLERRALSNRFVLRRDCWDPDVFGRDLARMEELGGLEYKVLGFKSILAERRCAYGEAWDYAERGVAASLGQSAGERGWILANLALLAVHRELRPPEVARALLEEMLCLAQAVSGLNANVAYWLVCLELRLGNPLAALRAHGEMVRSMRVQGRVPEGPIGGAAVICFGLGRFDDALQTCEAENHHATTVGDQMGLVAGLELLGSIHCSQRRDDLARQAWEQGAPKSSANPGRAFCCEVKLELLELLHGATSETRLNALAARPHASRPDMARLLAALQAFLAARTGDVDRAAQAIRDGNQASAWGGPTAWNALAPALVDVAQATRLRAFSNVGESLKFQEAAQEKLRVAPLGEEALLLARLVERALQQLPNPAVFPESEARPM